MSRNFSPKMSSSRGKAIGSDIFKLFTISFTLLILFIYNITKLSAQEKQTWLPNFQQPNSSLYQVNMQYKENGFSSLLVIKPEGTKKYHLVFMTQFGLKLMEFMIKIQSSTVMRRNTRPYLMMMS